MILCLAQQHYFSFFSAWLVWDILEPIVERLHHVLLPSQNVSDSGQSVSGSISVYAVHDIFYFRIQLSQFEQMDGI